MWTKIAYPKSQFWIIANLANTLFTINCSIYITIRNLQILDKTNTHIPPNNNYLYRWTNISQNIHISRIIVNLEILMTHTFHQISIYHALLSIQNQCVLVHKYSYFMISFTANLIIFMFIKHSQFIIYININIFFTFDLLSFSHHVYISSPQII